MAKYYFRGRTNIVFPGSWNACQSYLGIGVHVSAWVPASWRASVQIFWKTVGYLQTGEHNIHKWLGINKYAHHISYDVHLSMSFVYMSAAG